MWRPGRVEVDATDGWLDAMAEAIRAVTATDVDTSRLAGFDPWIRGPVDADVSRCRVEVAVIAGLDAPDELLAMCADLVPGYDRRWDILVAAELAPWTNGLVWFNAFGARLTVPLIRDRLDQIIVRAGR